METVSIDVKVAERIILLLNNIENIDEDLQEEISSIRGRIALHKALFDFEE